MLQALFFLRYFNSLYYETTTVVKNLFNFKEETIMGKIDERIEKTAKALGDMTPERVKADLLELIGAIDKYEEAGPIDILGGEKPESKLRIAKLGRVVNKSSKVIIMLKVLCKHYGIPYKQVELNEEKIYEIEPSLKALKKYE